MIYLDNAASTPCLECVFDAMYAANREWSNVHRGLHRYADATTKRYEEARAQVADFIQADPEEIVFTSGTTESLNMVAHTWGLLPGDTIVVTRMDHHSNLVPWQHLADTRGCTIKMVPLLNGELDLDYLEGLLQRRPAILALPSVSNVLGTVNPVAKITEMAHNVGTTVVVDSAQGVAHIPHYVHNMGVDFLAFSGHKLHGPTGVGVLYGKKHLLGLMKPRRYGGGMVANVSDDAFYLAQGTRRLEGGTPPIQQAIGLGAACCYWKEIGMDHVQTHIDRLTLHAYQRLEALPGVHILGPAAEKRAGIVSFTVDGVHAHDVAALLSDKCVAVRAGHHCALPLHRSLGVSASTRISFSYFNKLSEIDFFVDALTDIQSFFH